MFPPNDSNPSLTTPPTTTPHTIYSDIQLLLTEFQKLPPSSLIFLLFLFIVTICFFIPSALIERWLLGREELSHGLNTRVGILGDGEFGGELGGGLNLSNGMEGGNCAGFVAGFGDLRGFDGGVGNSFVQDVKRGARGVEISERVMVESV